MWHYPVFNGNEDNSSIFKFVDRNDEFAELEAKKIKVLKERHIEYYLFDDENIALLCKNYRSENKIDECLAAKQQTKEESKCCGNSKDNINSASGVERVRLLLIVKATY